MLTWRRAVSRRGHPAWLTPATCGTLMAVGRDKSSPWQQGMVMDVLPEEESLKSTDVSLLWPPRPPTQAAPPWALSHHPCRASPFPPVSSPSAFSRDLLRDLGVRSAQLSMHLGLCGGKSADSVDPWEQRVERQRKEDAAADHTGCVPATAPTFVIRAAGLAPRRAVPALRPQEVSWPPLA